MERSRSDVEKKLKDYGVLENDVPPIIEKLISEGFLNEKRFASAFASGKFRYKKWGRKRIINEMKRKGLSDELIDSGLAALSQTEYTKTLDDLLTKKWKQLERKIDKDEYDSVMAAKQKLVNYALQKGYEQDIIWERIKNVVKG